MFYSSKMAISGLQTMDTVFSVIGGVPFRPQGRSKRNGLTYFASPNRFGSWALEPTARYHAGSQVRRTTSELWAILGKWKSFPFAIIDNDPQCIDTGQHWELTKLRTKRRTFLGALMNHVRYVRTVLARDHNWLGCGLEGCNWVILKPWWK